MEYDQERRSPTPPVALSVAGDSLADQHEDGSGSAADDEEAEGQLRELLPLTAASQKEQARIAAEQLVERAVSNRTSRSTSLSTRDHSRSSNSSPGQRGAISSHDSGRIIRESKTAPRPAEARQLSTPPNPEHPVPPAPSGLSAQDSACSEVGVLYRSGKGTFETIAATVSEGPLAVRLVPGTRKGDQPRLGAVVAEVDEMYSERLPFRPGDVVVKVYGAAVRDWHYSSILRMFREAAGSITEGSPLQIEVARRFRRRRGWIEDPASREGSPQRSRAGSLDGEQVTGMGQHSGREDPGDSYGPQNSDTQLQE